MTRLHTKVEEYIENPTFRSMRYSSISGNNSQRVNGKLVLRMNTFQSTTSQWYEQKAHIKTGNYDFYDQAFNSAGLGSGSFSGWAHAPMSDALNRAATSFLVRLNDLKINIAQAYAERQQTANLVGNTARVLASAYTDIRHGKVPRIFQNVNLKRSVRGASNLWLQYQYGWRPLLSDIYGSLTLSHSREPTFNLYSYGRSESSQKRSNVTEKFITDLYINARARVKCDAYIRCKDAALLKSRNVGINNPLLILWELLPYSFVVDWFIGVGDYLQSFNAVDGFAFLDQSSTFRSELAWYGKCRPNPAYKPSSGPYSPWPTSCKDAGWGSGYAIDKWRELSIPRSVLPSFGSNPVSLNHCLSGISLLVQAFLGKKTIL